MTHTAHSGLHTGIQRVVRKLAEHLPGIASMRGIPCDMVVFRDGCFQRFSSQKGFVAWDYRRFRNEFYRLLPAWYKRLVTACFGSQTFISRVLAPEPRKLGIYFLPVALLALGLWGFRMLTLPMRQIRFQPEDILLMPDGYWVVKKIWPGVDRAKRKGAKIVFLVYDVISISHPQFFVDGAKDQFEKYLQNIAKFADLVLTISNTVAAELRDTLARSGWGVVMPPIQSFTLGADIANASNSVRESVTELFHQETPVFLVAATLEPRKNHKVVLDAFEHLWETDRAHLLLVGRKGWLHAELIDRIESSPHFNQDLLMIHDLNDSELSRCYELCAGVICPSHAEGFGLPIIEALSHGKTVFVSDIAIHREVGKEDCIYFSKDSGEELAELMRKFLRGGRANQVSRREMVTWNQSAREVLDGVLGPSAG